MAIPAVQWIVNGVAALGCCLVLCVEKLLIPNADLEVYPPACVWLLWFAFLFLKAGSGVFFGDPRLIGVANGHAILGAILMMFLSGLILNNRLGSSAFFVFGHGFAMFAGCVIAFAYSRQWYEWAESTTHSNSE